MKKNTRYFSIYFAFRIIILILFGMGLVVSASICRAQGTWRLQTIIDGAPPLQGVRAVSQDIVWACSGDAFAYRTTDGGQNWQESALITSDEPIFVIEAIDSMTAFAGGGNIFSNFGDAVLYRTTDGGQSWDSVYTAIGSYTFWNMIHFFDAQNGIAMSDPPKAGQPFVIVKTTDGGTNWTPISMPPTPNPNEYGFANAFQFYDEMNGWFGTNTSDRIFRTTDGGENWTGYPTGNTNGSIWSVNFVSLTTGVRTSDSSPYLARTTDGGQTWTPVNGLPVSDIRIIRAGAVASMSGSSQIWISGEATSNSTPFMLTSTDSGQTWIEQVLPSLSGEFIQDMSAAVFGNSIQVWAVTLDHSDFSSGGQILTFRPSVIVNVPADLATIQAAIDSATNGDTVLVADGTYYENINFKGKAITVASNYTTDGDTNHINNTIINGSQPSNPDSGSVVYFVSGEDTNSVLSGFTITGGSGTSLRVFPHWMLSKAGGGIHIVFSGAKIENNKIINNNITSSGETATSGAAIVAYGDVGDYVIIRANQILENTATSETYVFGTVNWGTKETTVFEGNVVSGNVCNADNAYGGGLLIFGQEGWRGAYIVRNNIIKDNILNGISDASGGGIHIGNCSPEITKNIISGNEAITGGGIAVNHWDTSIGIQKPLLINNTIFNNSAVTSGGGIYIDGSQQPEVKTVNNIIWGNSAPTSPQISVSSGSISVHYSDVRGGWQGEGNIDFDPLFADTVNYYLSEQSPCIDTGNDSSIFNDIEIGGMAVWPAMGTKRNDMGAYGGNPDSIYKYITSVDDYVEQKIYTPLKYALNQNYPNPFNPKTVIGWQLAVGSEVELSIYNLLGQKVSTLVSERQNAGYHQVEWDADGMSSGVYIYRLETDNGFVQTKKLVLLK